jgi:cellulose biosynthesis protein BcsQ
MIDLFNFLKDANTAEAIAGFIVGAIVTLTFLTYVVYLFFSSFYGKRVDEARTEAKNAIKELAEQKDKLREAEKERDEQGRKAKERGDKIEERDKQISKLNDAIANAIQTGTRAEAKEAAVQGKFADVVSKHNKIVARYNNLITVATSLKKQVTSLNDQAKLFEKLQGQLWDLPVDPAALVPFRPLGKNKAAIIAVINLKGGVGKTTLSANIGVTYAREMRRRVLAIDLDFQASLTGLCLSSADIAQLMIGDGRLIDNVFKDRSAGLAKRAFNNVVHTREPQLHLMANSESFAKVEEEAKARWIINHGGLDVRCILRSALHDPIFQDNFDLILIDCPPRWTTGSINAIACCDYVLIPTMLDRVSSEAVPRLLQWLRDLRRAAPDLYGHFEILGVLGNRAFPREKLIAQEQDIWDGLTKKCMAAWSVPVYAFATIVKDKAEFRRAANNRQFAALHPDLQPAFLKLVGEIEARRSAHEGP